jgi:hypothetical protein
VWILVRTVLVLATPVAVASLVGDLTTEETRKLGNLTYGLDPITFGPTGDLIVGIVSCSLVVATLALMVWGTATGRESPSWWLVLLPLMASGAMAAVIWRVWTQGSIGANIGEGLSLFFCGPGAVLAAALAAVAWMTTRKERL